MGAFQCGTAFELLSDTHVMDEAARLRSANGAFAGPKCRACGRDYLDAPDEFLLDGAEVASARRDGGGAARKGTVRARSSESAATPDRVRLIHKPCRGRSGARISATLDHRRHRQSSDNVGILLALVNGAGIAKIMRMMAPAGSGKSCGAKRVYNLFSDNQLGR